MYRTIEAVHGPRRIAACSSTAAVQRQQLAENVVVCWATVHGDTFEINVPSKKAAKPAPSAARRLRRRKAPNLPNTRPEAARR